MNRQALLSILYTKKYQLRMHSAVRRGVTVPVTGYLAVVLVLSIAWANSAVNAASNRHSAHPTFLVAQANSSRCFITEWGEEICQTDSDNLPAEGSVIEEAIKEYEETRSPTNQPGEVGEDGLIIERPKDSDDKKKCRSSGRDGKSSDDKDCDYDRRDYDRRDYDRRDYDRRDDDRRDDDRRDDDRRDDDRRDDDHRDDRSNNSDAGSPTEIGESEAGHGVTDGSDDGDGGASGGTSSIADEFGGPAIPGEGDSEPIGSSDNPTQ